MSGRSVIYPILGPVNVVIVAKSLDQSHEISPSIARKTTPTTTTTPPPPQSQSQPQVGFSFS